MTRLVALTRSEASTSVSGYDVQLGPLLFVTPADVVGETTGDGLDVVGAALTASERRPRPLKLKLPVRGSNLDLDTKASGLRLRRQLRAVMNNAKWRLTGFYFVWEPDPDLDGWLMIGGGDLEENQAGVTFGEYEMELENVFIVGRPGTHRPGRRAAINDLRTGMAPRDTRRLLYSTDFAAVALPAEPLILPGDSVALTSSGNRPVASSSLGPERAGLRHLWRTASAEDAEILSYIPDPVLLPDRKSYLELDELGSVRVWDLSKATSLPPNPVGYSTERDESPDLFYGWEQVMGDALGAQTPLAVENGACRLIWLGPTGTEGLAIEYWDSELEHFRRIGRILHSLNVTEQRVVELTPERAVLEWRAGRYCMRAVLQRGWWGPRLESYDDGGSTTRLEFAPEGTGKVKVTQPVLPWVHTIAPTSGGHPLLWAQGANDEIVDTIPTVLTGEAATFRRTRVLVAQLGCPPGPSAEGLAGLSLIDARGVPVLVGRR